VTVVEADSDDSGGECGVAAAAAPSAAAPSPPAEAAAPAPAAWDPAGRDVALLSKARGVKEGADDKFKAGLHEIAADGYSEAVLLLADDEYGPERMLCYLNRAACRLQTARRCCTRRRRT
jgi:hypothetical protein